MTERCDRVNHEFGDLRIVVTRTNRFRWRARAEVYEYGLYCSAWGPLLARARSRSESSWRAGPFRWLVYLRACRDVDRYFARRARDDRRRARRERYTRVEYVDL
ncbi:MAG: hypothetical protein ACRDZ4_04760 [Egibacteraceae bacterium]